MTDVGLRLVDSLYEQMMIDDEWAVRRERGFTWWAYRLAQHVEVGPPMWSEDRYICSVRIWTEVVRDVDPATDPGSVLGSVNQAATLSALVWDPSEATINDCCTATVHDEIFVWLSKVLATAAVLQNTTAHSRAHSLARATGGAPAASDHPSGRTRRAMDDLLNVPERVVAAEGATSSKFIGAHFRNVEAFLRRMNFFGFVDDDGLTCEVPFTGSTPSVELPEGAAPQTALVQMFTDATHPDAGNGLLAVLQLPFNSDAETIAAQANKLNLTESKGDTGPLLLGAWSPHPSSDTTLTFSVFVPNAIAQWVLVENLVAYMSSHAGLAARELIAFPDRVGTSGEGASHEPAVSSSNPTGSELAEQALELAKSTAQASSRLAASAAKLGIAKLRKRLNEGRNQD